MNSSEADRGLHTPVMVNEVLSYLHVQENPSGIFLDATTSTGGHALAITQEMAPDGRLICLDLDKQALETAKKRLEEAKPEVKLYQANYTDMDSVLELEEVSAVDGLLFDLGFSSFQLENEKRGFSFQRDGPLDMRMNRKQELTAERVVNEYPYGKLKRIIREFGEERWASKIAHNIVSTRDDARITTTKDLVQIIRESIPKKVQGKSRIHPATKTFQALRIHVNGEIDNLETGLKKGFNVLSKGGTMVFLSYHSLEDRRVKKFFNYKKKDCICPPELPVCRCDKVQEMKILTSGAEKPSKREIKANPRSRSARLRAGRKIVDH